MESVSSIVDRIKVAAEAYYLGEAIMTDDEFDRLVDDYTNRTGEKLPVGWGVKDGDIRLPIRMGSLDKVTETDQVERFLSSIPGEVSVSNKWDGMACYANVKDGVISYALTRGNGVTGKDVTRVVKHIPSAVAAAANIGDGHLRFEVVLAKSKLPSVNEWYEKEYGDANHYANTRNAVPGLLRSSKHNPEVIAPFLDIKLHFEEHLLDRGSVIDHLTSVTAARDGYDYDIDGIVISSAEEDVRNTMGYHSSGNPRWAVAFKFPPREKATKLIDVQWTVGRTGRVTPVAEVEPVDLGTIVRFVTLHNEDRVAELGVNIGDTVVVSKRGDVIPAVEYVQSKGDGPKVAPPATVDGVDPALILDHSFASLGVKHVSIAFFRAMYDNSPWSSVPDGWEKALALTVADIEKWDGFQTKAAERAVANLSAALRAPVQEWIGALNIPIVSVNTATNVLRETGSLPALIEELGSSTPDLGANVGGKKTDSLVTALPALRDALAVLTTLGIDTVYAAPTVTATRFSGKKIVITGTLPSGISRARAKDIVVAAGGKPCSSVSSSTDYLFAGENAGSKLAAAEKHGVEVVTGPELEAVLAELSPLVL